jgi:hypothetical protein
MALPFMAEFGWEPMILKVDPLQQEGIKDFELCRTIPKKTRVWEAGCVPLPFTRWFGLRNVGLRSFFHLAVTGSQNIREEKPDVILFSTTMFPLMTLGRYWHWKHAVPYVLDYQDPWAREVQKGERRIERGKGEQRQPAGLKVRLVNCIARILEPLAMRHVAHVVSVSPAYIKTLVRWYPWLSPKGFTVLPFGAAETDYKHLCTSPVRQTAFDAKDGKRHWVYAGCAGRDMALALRSIFGALSSVVKSLPGLRDTLRLHFLGTDYAPRGRGKKTVEPIAAEAGCGDMVIEQTDRIPYLEALQCLLDADALIVPGLNVPGYTASKIYPYILARKPLLAVFHEQSSVVDFLRETKAGTIVSFRSDDTPECISQRILCSCWLQEPPVPQTDWTAFEPYTARAMTRKLCAVFDGVVQE